MPNDPEQGGGNEEEGIWASILKQASRQGQHQGESGVAVDDRPRVVVVLGDSGCGKTSLIARLKGVDADEVSTGLALDYTYIDVFEDDADDAHLVDRINVWQLSGESSHASLIKSAINADNASSLLFVICLSMTAPWAMDAALNKWLDVIEGLLTSVDLTDAERDDLRRATQLFFQRYKEPTAAAAAAAAAGSDEEAGTSEAGASGSSGEAAAAAGGDDNGGGIGMGDEASPDDGVAIADDGGEDGLDFGAAGNDSADLDAVLLPLPEGALERNLGVPIVIAPCKCDLFEDLVQNHAYKEAHFDFIQRYLRQRALSVGASLFYVSSLEETNTESLWSYIRHRLYGFPFDVRAEPIEKERILIPSGWDTLSKISFLDDSAGVLTKNREVSADGIAFNDVIKEPFTIRPSEDVLSATTAEDDQAFLQRYREYIDQEPESSSNENPLASLQAMLGPKAGASGADGGHAPSIKATGRKGSLENLLGAGKSKRRASTVDKKKSGTGGGGGAAAGGDDMNQISSFFSSLLTKGAPSASERKQTERALENIQEGGAAAGVGSADPDAGSDDAGEAAEAAAAAAVAEPVPTPAADPEPAAEAVVAGDGDAADDA